MLTASLRNWWSHPDGWFLNLLFPIKPGSSREKGAAGGVEPRRWWWGLILDLLVIDTRAVNTLGCRPDSLTRLLFTRPLKSREGPPALPQLPPRPPPSSSSPIIPFWAPAQSLASSLCFLSGPEMRGMNTKGCVCERESWVWGHEEMISCIYVCFPFSRTKRIAGGQVTEVWMEPKNMVKILRL